MRTLARKIISYCKDYIGGDYWIKAWVMPALLILIIANYFELQYSYRSGTISSDPAKREESIVMLRDYIFFYAFSYTLKYGVDLFNAYFVASSMRSGFRNFFYEYLTIKYSKFRSIGIGEAHYNIIRRANALAEFLTILTMSFVSNFFFFLIVLHAVSARIETRVCVRMLVALSIFVLVSLVLQYFRSKVRKSVNNGLQLNSRILYDVLFNYERITAYDTLDIESQKYWKSMDLQTKYAIIYWISYEGINLFNSIVFILVNVYLIQQFNTSPNITKDDLKRFILVITKLNDKVLDISRSIDELFTAFTNLDQSHIAGEPADEGEGLIPAVTYNDSIVAENLGFGYDEHKIFQKVFCSIARGEKIAITGANGHGKSTFMKLLLGFYEYEGSLTIDKLEFSKVSRKALRNLIAYVPQNAQLFDTTIMENLVLANEDITSEKVVEYCKLYGMHDLFKELGYDKRVGERGKNLSGGQKQKICFLRAVIRNTPVLLLDEATANMDAGSELELIENVHTHMESKTVIMIIHNLSLLKHFDRIFFFFNHTLDGQDSFSELYSKNERFRKFYDDSIRKEKRCKDQL